MTQRLALGISVGASNSVAVAATEEGDDGLGPSGGGYLRSHPSVLRLSEDMAPTLGAGTRSTGRHSSDVLLEGFLARVGDPVGILAEDGSSYSAPDLVATAIGCLVDEIAEETGRSGAQATVACHPAWWSRHTVDIQRDALERAGLGEVTLVPEPTAAIRWLDAAHGWADDGAVIVFDLGATGSTVSVVRTGEHAILLGTPLRNTDVAGAEFDLLTMRYVLANAVLAADFDPFDPVVERELSALRERCRKAKEELSINTATVVPVRLDPADPHGTVRLVRGELEDLLRGPLSSAMDLIRDAVHRAGLDIGDVGRVLLTGGGGAIPLVAELVSTEFGLPVVAAPDPEHTTARGAALLAADLLAAETDQLPLVDPVTEDETVPQPRALPSAGLAALPEERPARRRALTSRQRLAVVAGTAAAIGLLATGTLAIGTGIQSGPSTPASTEQSSTGAAQVAATPGARTSDPSAPSGVAATDSASSPGRAGTGTSQAGSPTSPAQGTTVAVVNSEQSPDQPAPAPAADSPAPQPAPQPQAQQPAPAPAPAPAPTNPSPPTQQQPRPTQPTAPSLPTGVLGDTLGTVLRAPGEILGGSGG
ncbi:Hsp70 family protein [Nocardia gamkensis]|uniref:Hsp70 family protein n=1 Tax=Nocardia gamkensis TaxID=352869 RepID=A0A7X6R3F7_9NOCA|nr:Hsp70 family protein [Nocardia gamkensis]NKY27414.1 Hsp70 family protein [Nocardia gamkensis]NQE65941.1 Chaperone protein DnaK [Nocardia gamkensis]